MKVEKINQLLKLYDFLLLKGLPNPQEHSLGGGGEIMVAPRPDLATPGTEKQTDGFSYLLRPGSWQWDWAVADDIEAFDWSLMVTVRPPGPM